jgi:hypothetical protein
VAILDTAIQGIGRLPTGALEVRARPTAGGDEIAFEVDEVIAATGFVAPLLDLPNLGVTTFGQSRLPAQTPYWESSSVPGIYFAGTISQGAGGLKKHGQPANSGAVHGARYNARLLARHIAATRFSAAALERPRIAPDELIDTLVKHLSFSPELWHQRAYLARIVSLDPADGPRDEGLVPLEAFVDGGGDDGAGDAVALTLEADGSGAIYPVVYVRRDGRVEEHMFDPDLLLRYDTPEVRRRLAEIVASGVTAG